MGCGGFYLIEEKQRWPLSQMSIYRREFSWVLITLGSLGFWSLSNWWGWIEPRCSGGLRMRQACSGDGVGIACKSSVWLCWYQSYLVADVTHILAEVLSDGTFVLALLCSMLLMGNFSLIWYSTLKLANRQRCWSYVPGWQLNLPVLASNVFCEPSC